MTSRPETGDAGRRAYIDWARGIAVLVMMHAHILDSWTLRSERGATVYPYLTFVGGLAAPLFLWLAGLGLALAAERTLARTGDRARAARLLFRRGLQILGLAFLFRLQAFVVSPGNPLVSLLRVDILNIMGPSMAATALAWWMGGSRRGGALLTASIAIGLAMVTPLVRTAAWLGALPAVLQWYVSPAGNHSTFTLFPWSAFVFAGAACGVWLSGVQPAVEQRALRLFGGAGALVLLASLYLATRPSIYAASSFWTTSPTYFGVRVGLLMVLLALLAVASPLRGRVPRVAQVLERFGRSSLFIYWIHVELVYGYASIWIHHRLPLWGTALGFVAFAAAMYGTVGLRDRLLAAWRGRSSGGPAPAAARA